MTDLLPSFTALITIIIGVTMLGLSRRLPGTGLARVAKNHLTEMSRAWLLLAFYYSVRATLPFFGYPANINQSSYDPEAPLYSFIFHLLVMVFCTSTNIYLRRAILELEVAYKTPEAEAIPQNKGLLGMLYVRFIAILTDPGILASFILSISFLLFPIVVAPGTYQSLYIVIAYLAQLIVSSALFLRLASTYWQFQRSRAVAGLAFIYGTLQIVYPILQLVFGSRVYEFILTIAKISLAFYVGAFSLTLSKRAQHAQNRSSILRHPEVIHAELTPLQRLGARIEEQAKLHAMFQACLATIILIIFVGLTRFGYSWFVGLARSAALSNLAILLLRLAWLLLSFLIFQYLAYLVIFRCAYSVAWGEHCSGALKSSVHIEGSNKQFYEKWLNTTLAPAQTLEPTRDRVQVILIHGIFSRGESCWGLLPAILLESGLVSRVHLVSYSHSLWSSGKRLDQVAEELITVLQDFASGSKERTIVFAHSLGGLLSMRAISDIVKNKPDIAARIKHLVCAASPLTGSKYAAFGLPWPWPLRLSRGSEFVLSTLERFSALFVPAGYITGEETPLCTCSFFYGTRDGIAGSDIKILKLPGERVPFPAWHSICAVFRRDSPQAAAYIKELTANTRSAQLMQILLANLMGKRSPQLALIFEMKARNLQTAIVTWEATDESWDNVVHAPVRRDSGELLLRDVLQASYQNRAREDNWNLYWTNLSSSFGVAFTRRELIRMKWPSEAVLYLFSNREAGFVLVTAETYPSTDLEVGATVPDAISSSRDMSGKLDVKQVLALLERRFPELPSSSGSSHLSVVLNDLSRTRYRTLADLEDVLDRTEQARASFRAQRSDPVSAAEELAVAIAIVDLDYRETGWDEDDKELFRDLESLVQE